MHIEKIRCHLLHALKQYFIFCESTGEKEQLKSAKISNWVLFTNFFTKIGLFCNYLHYGSHFLLQRVYPRSTFHEKLTRDMMWLGDRGGGTGGGSGGLPGATTLWVSFFTTTRLSEECVSREADTWHDVTRWQRRWDKRRKWWPARRDH